MNRFVVSGIHVILFILVLVGVYSKGVGELAVWFVVHWVGDGGLPLVGGWPLAVGGWTRVGHSIYLPRQVLLMCIIFQYIYTRFCGRRMVRLTLDAS